MSKPFNKLGEVSVPAHLAGRIHGRIAALERRGQVVRVSGLVASTVLSLAGFAASCTYAWTSAASSGFGDYVSIIFSDGGAALSYSRELALALVESSPFLGIALALVASLAVAWSVANVMKQSIKHTRNQTSYGYSQ